METIEKQASPVELLEIEKELAGPDADAALEKYDALLTALDERIRLAMSEGLSPAEFGRVERLANANVMARKVMRIVKSKQ